MVLSRATRRHEAAQFAETNPAQVGSCIGPTTGTLSLQCNEPANASSVDLAAAVPLQVKQKQTERFAMSAARIELAISGLYLARQVHTNI